MFVQSARSMFVVFSVCLFLCLSPVGFSCSFDKDLCGFSQATNDKFDWTRRSGSTSSSSTGPSGDHTGGGERGKHKLRGGDVYRLIVKNYWTLHFSDIAPTEDHTSGGGEGRKESAVGEGKGGKSQLWGRGRKRSAVTSLICG